MTLAAAPDKARHTIAIRTRERARPDSLPTGITASKRMTGNHRIDAAGIGRMDVTENDRTDVTGNDRTDVTGNDMADVTSFLTSLKTTI